MPLYLREAEYDKIRKREVTIPDEFNKALRTVERSMPHTAPGYKRVKRLLDPKYNPQRSNGESESQQHTDASDGLNKISGSELKSSLNHMKKDGTDFGEYKGQIEGFMKSALERVRRQVKPSKLVPKTSKAKTSKPSKPDNAKAGNLNVTLTN